MEKYRNPRETEGESISITNDTFWNNRQQVNSKLKRNVYNVVYSTLINIILALPYLLINFHRVCNKSNTMGDTSGAGIYNPSGAPKLIPAFSGVRVAPSFNFCVVCCRSLFGLWSIFFLPLHYLSFIDLRLLITLFDIFFQFFSCLIWICSLVSGEIIVLSTHTEMLFIHGIIIFLEFAVHPMHNIKNQMKHNKG